MSKKKAIKSISESIALAESKNHDADEIRNIGVLMERFLSTPDKAERKRLAEEFKTRRLELAAFLRDNPEVVEIEARRALIEAACGGTLTATETRKDSRGNRVVSKKVQQTAPDMAALAQLIEDVGSGDGEADDGFLDALKEAGTDAWKN